METASDVAPAAQTSLATGADASTSLDRRRDRAAQLYRQGLSTRAIADELGVTVPTVLRHLKCRDAGPSASLERRRDRAAQLYGQGLSAQAIGRELNVTAPTVLRYLKCGGVKSRPSDWFSGLAGGKLSLSAAARKKELDPQTLRKAIEAGIVRAERIEHPGLGPFGVGFLLDEKELDEDLEAAPMCEFPKCEQKALTGAAGCGDHAGPLTNKGRTWDEETRERMGAGKRGKPRPDQAERLRKSWETDGAGAPSNLLKKAPQIRGRTRQVWFGRWSGKRGGRERLASVDSTFDEKASELRRIHDANPRLGQSELARRIGLSRWQVRQLLSQHSAL